MKIQILLMVYLDIQICIDNVSYTFLTFDTLLWSGKYTIAKDKNIILMRMVQEVK